ncbi:hypothetical protein NDU88_002347 [Pleurodeles waltl]|uniref:Uncharacterized protein n=1 Tax=Pleurodeles waltl TaxID=8319 RepID=A0AAV7P9P0_PLEWA|nr:hypothetical protein NDU88_002347 [Pleurodeles waltl]
MASIRTQLAEPRGERATRRRGGEGLQGRVEPRPIVAGSSETAAAHHSAATGPNPPAQPPTMSDTEQTTTMDRRLQEITEVSRRLEGMDTAITSLTTETKSMRLDIAGFQSRVTGVEHHMVTFETRIHTVQDRDQDLLYLCSKLTDLEDRSRIDNVRFFGFSESVEGSDIQSFLCSVLPKLTELTFDPPLEFQRVHRLGLRRHDGTSRSRLIIACFLRHGQASQLLSAARAHGPFRAEDYEMHIMADYSKDTNERRKSFLALRPRLCQLELKYGLFELARLWVTLWVTENGVSKDFYDSKDLRLFLDTATLARSHGPPSDSRSASSPPPDHRGANRHNSDHRLRGKDLERLVRTHDDRGQVLQAVALHTQLSETNLVLP